MMFSPGTPDAPPPPPVRPLQPDIEAAIEERKRREAQRRSLRSLRIGDSSEEDTGLRIPGA